MKLIHTDIEGVILIEPIVFADERGYFFESFHKNKLSEHLQAEFVQDNESLSHKGVLRGLHFQHPPYSQGKLVRVITGSVMDVAVDLRKNSNTYGKHIKQVLSSKNKLQLYIPEGFAHGFLVLEDNTIFSYKCSDYYKKEAEDALFWNDELLGIDWGIANPIVSEKDKKAKNFSNFESPF
ncbi:MAG: dTDP-4-dehydrorhamnose 3,5-epimerase [Flavobacteriaceae bacterium]|nr:dTDP-4-dehydrorhamnose 3,5-epimerase [Flavobacteriaceae bacterium]